ncbi:hypothetical protein RhiirA1_542684 [Rhizophagus irregularis]|uniref:Uncharacterized protein n=1 Tax=Rhizophagus irregularis TaxID=588596 RepID=A0A2N0QVC1_9GLOM|nr:hypothetical protein RhiirA1_542684 [Rhizophagus irregularis]
MSMKARYVTAKEIKEYKPEELIKFLKKNLNFDGVDLENLEIIREQEVSGRSFLNLTHESYGRWGMPSGLACSIANFAKKCKKKKLDPRKLLTKHGVENGRIIDMPQFTPKIHKIDDKDDYFLHCLKDIHLRLNNMGTIDESNETICCEYISTILHACIHITRKLTGKNISIYMQFDGKNAGRVNYVINASEKLICVTGGKQHQIDIEFAQNVTQCNSAYKTNQKKRKAEEKHDYIFGIVTTTTAWYFLLYTPDGISCTSRNPLNIRFVESALEEGSEEEKDLHKNLVC